MSTHITRPYFGPNSYPNHIFRVFYEGFSPRRRRDATNVHPHAERNVRVRTVTHPERDHLHRRQLACAVLGPRAWEVDLVCRRAQEVEDCWSWAAADEGVHGLFREIEIPQAAQCKKASARARCEG